MWRMGDVFNHDWLSICLCYMCVMHLCHRCAVMVQKPTCWSSSLPDRSIHLCYKYILNLCLASLPHSSICLCKCKCAVVSQKKQHMLGEVSIHQTTVHIFFFSSMSFTSVITVMSLPRNSSIHLGYKCVMWLCDTGVLWLYGDKPSDIPKFAWQQCGETGLHCGVCGQPCGGKHGCGFKGILTFMHFAVLFRGKGWWSCVARQ